MSADSRLNGALLNSYASHRTFEMYGVAARAASLPIELVSFTDHERPGGPRGRWKNLLDPWLAAHSARRHGGNSGILIMREFLTLPLLFAAPAYRNVRRRMWLVSVHNLQRARHRTLDRIALRALVRYGFRLILPESNAGCDLLRLRDASASLAVLPLGVTEAQASAPRGPKESGRIALVGRSRREKRLGEGIERVVAALREMPGSWPLAIGTDDRRLLESASSRGLDAVDTTNEETYRALLARSRVVVVDYDPANYELRTSGVVLDAAAAGAAVVCPDFPVLRDQIGKPVEIGATYGETRSLAEALSRAARIASEDPGRFDVYLEARSGRALAAALEALLKSHQPARAA